MNIPIFAKGRIIFRSVSSRLVEQQLLDVLPPESHREVSMWLDFAELFDLCELDCLAEMNSRICFQNIKKPQLFERFPPDFPCSDLQTGSSPHTSELFGRRNSTPRPCPVEWTAGWLSSGLWPRMRTFAGVDPARAARLLERIREQKIHVLLVSHEETVMRLADRVLTVDGPPLRIQSVLVYVCRLFEEFPNSADSGPVKI